MYLSFKHQNIRVNNKNKLVIKINKLIKYITFKLIQNMLLKIQVSNKIGLVIKIQKKVFTDKNTLCNRFNLQNLSISMI